MALTIDATLGTFTSNSYVDLAYADDYWANHFNATKVAQWLALTDEQKTTLLISGTRVIDTLRFTNRTTRADYSMRYNRLTGTVIDMSYLWREPVKWYYYQKLQFPRNLDVDPSNGSLYIPEPIKMAQCEQAMYLLNFDDTAMANRMQGVVLDTMSVGRGQIDITQEYASTGSAFAPMALEFVRPFLVKNAKAKRG
jgi:hypothetical protein